MNLTHKICIRLLPICVLVAGLYFVCSKDLTASYADKNVSLYVEIDGVSYGNFSKIEGLDEALSVKTQSAFKVSMERNFVAEPSLYLWAKSREIEHNVLGDITVIAKDSSGVELHRYVLKRCQPLSWTVEKSSPAVGGFYEIVNIAIQEIQFD